MLNLNNFKTMFFIDSLNLKFKNKLNKVLVSI